MLGLTAICACLIGLVPQLSIKHVIRFQLKNTGCGVLGYFSRLNHGTAGDIRLSQSDASARLAPGIILICLGMICTAYSQKSGYWHWYGDVPVRCQQNTDDSRLHLPVLPFPGIFLAEMAQTDMGYFIPSRVLVV